MANKGAVTGSITTSGGSYTIPAGYHNGSGKVTGPTLANLIGSNVTLANAAYLLTGYTAYGKSGTKYTGSMKNNGAVTKTFTPSTSSQSYTIPAGYHNGSGKVTCKAVNVIGTSTYYTFKCTYISETNYNYKHNVNITSIPNYNKLVLWKTLFPTVGYDKSAQGGNGIQYFSSDSTWMGNYSYNASSGLIEFYSNSNMNNIDVYFYVIT